MPKYTNLDDYINKDLKELQDKHLNEEERNAIQAKGKEFKLIPQFWWGDVSNEGDMKAIILGVNPSLKIKKDNKTKLNDLLDNEKYKDDLVANLKLDARLDNTNNLLLNKKDEAFFSYWWNNYVFQGLNINTMDGIAIYNLFGFYSSSFPKKINAGESHICKVKDINDHIKEQIKKQKTYL